MQSAFHETPIFVDCIQVINEDMDDNLDDKRVNLDNAAKRARSVDGPVPAEPPPKQAAVTDDIEDEL